MKKFLSFILVTAMVLSVSGVAMAATVVTNEEQFKSALATGGDIELGASFEVDEVVAINGGVTVNLDLKGFTITGKDTTSANFGLIDVVGGTLIVNDTAGDGKITLESDINSGWNRYSAVIANRGGSVTIKGGALEHLGGTDMAYVIDNNSTLGKTELVVEGGSLKTPYRSIRQFVNNTTHDNIVTIKGGTIVGQIWMQDPSSGTVGQKATLVIEGGNITGNDRNGGRAVYIETYGDAATFNVEIKGGEIKGPITSEDGKNTTENVKNFISGGTFTELPAEGMLGDDIVGAEVTDGTDTVYAFGEASIKQAANEDGVTKVTVTKGTVNFDAGDVPAGVTIAENNGGNAQVNGEDVVGETEMPAVTYTVTAVASPSDASWGTVTGGGKFDEGTEVTLTATPKDGFFFDGWVDESGAPVSKNNPFVIDALDKDYTLVAIFAPEAAEDPTVIYTVTFDPGEGTGTKYSVEVTDKEDDGETYKLPECTFTAPAGKQFKAWSVDGEEKAAGAEIIVNTSMTITAVWEDVEPEKPTRPSHGNHITVKYEGGNRFSTNKSAVPTSVEIDGVPVSFVGDGRSFTVSCIEPGNHWITVRWHSTSVTTNFTADATVVCMPNGIPKTGDVSVMAYALMAVIVAAGVMRKK